MQWFKPLLAQNPGTFVENRRVNLGTSWYGGVFPLAVVVSYVQLIFVSSN